MSNSLMIHRVESIEINTIHQLETNTYVLGIRIKSKEGFFDLDLFSNNKDNLKIL